MSLEDLQKAEQSKADSIKADNKQLRKKLEILERQLDEAMRARFTLNISSHKHAKGNFCRVIVPDSHGAKIDKAAAAAFLSDLEKLEPAEIVMLGDHLDAGGFLAQHHTFSYATEANYSFADDVEATNVFLDEIQKRSNAKITYIEGNHERRIEKWITSQPVRNKKDLDFLNKIFSVESVLFLKKRKIRHIRQGRFYDGLKIPGTIKLGNCFFTHGSSTAQHAASVHVKKFGGNVVYGHTHRADSYIIRQVKTGLIGGYSPGCLCELQPLWRHTEPTDWSHGYGLQSVTQKTGNFLHINVTIANGKSLLAPLLGL